MKITLPEQAVYRILQITDCHLLAEPSGVYNGCQPAIHLQQIVFSLTGNPPDAVILTGDLTQDHSRASYQLLADLFVNISCPVLLLPGNHDDLAELLWLTQTSNLQLADTLVLAKWQLFLLNSKGTSPAGSFDHGKQVALQQQFSQSSQPFFWLFMHHHPLPLHCFIDQHGLTEQADFWALLFTEPRVKGVAHGHAHLAYHRYYRGVAVVGCPASSVQFLKTADWQTVNAGPQWCEWHFAATGDVSWRFQTLA